MQPLEVGDLNLQEFAGNRQQRLFKAIQQRITSAFWGLGSRLPSSRAMASELGLSRNTVVAAYEQLQAEGYIESRPGAGFYVCLSLPEHYLVSAPTVEPKPARPDLPEHDDINRSFAPGVPDLSAFPFLKWQRLLQQHAGRSLYAGNGDLQGLAQLRQVLSEYLRSSRSVNASPERIIITSGAQQALALAMLGAVKPGGRLLLEQPGYAQVKKVAELAQVDCEALPVNPEDGWQLENLSADADAVYLTPSNQYPLGQSLNTEQRVQLLQWAKLRQAWVIEDDYDSEFQFAHRPYTSMHGLAAQLGDDSQVIYVGSFSKVMFNALRIGYMVVPEALVVPCLDLKDSMSGDTPALSQLALADFIEQGDLLRHIRKMRRLYQQKYQAMLKAFEECFPPTWQVVSQAAGLHLTIRWRGANEQELVRLAAAHNIIIRPLGYYELPKLQRDNQRAWQGAVLGFGNTALQQIPELMSTLGKCAWQLEQSTCT